MTKAFARNREIIAKAMDTQLKSEGVDLHKVDNDKFEKLVDNFLFVVQAIWYRLKDDKSVEELFNTYAPLVPGIAKALSKHSFDDLIYSYRLVYTNLYEVKKGAKRWYKLNKDTLTEFINDVNAEKVEVINKVSKKPYKKIKKTLTPVSKGAPKEPEKKSAVLNLMQDMYVKPSKKRGKTNQRFVDVPTNEIALIPQDTYIRVLLSDKSVVNGRYVDAKAETFNVKDREDKITVVYFKDVVEVIASKRSLRYHKGLAQK